MRATQSGVGEDAVTRYDSADSVLVAPHYSQIWRHLADEDFVPAGRDTLAEVTAACGWMEDRVPAFGGGGAINLYLLWLAPDAATLAGALPVGEVLARHLGR